MAAKQLCPVVRSERGRQGNDVMRIALLACILSLALAASAASATPALAAGEQIKIGTLDCVIEGGTGSGFGSVKDLRCEFTPLDGGPAEPYFGVVERIGLDIGTTTSSVVKWLVLATSSKPYSRGDLAGDYTGVSAEVTAGAGVGANALIGRGEAGFILQPLSVQGQGGLNLAAGIAVFQLRSL